MQPDFYLGIDLGTSGVKVLLMDERQTPIATAQQELIVSRPQPLWSEQDPNAWWEATVHAMQMLKKNHAEKLAQVRAIGLSGQQHGATLLDKNNEVLRPAILWNDQRSFKECELLLQRVPNAHQITGNLIYPGFTAPKILWVKQHEPEVFKHIAKILLPKDYLRLKITGDFASDLSDASGTCWVDVAKRKYSTEMIEATEILITQLPKLFEGSEVTGTLKPEIADDFGLAEDCVVVAGGGDNAASAISMGVVTTGAAFLSLGTSGVYFVADDQYRPHPKAGMHTMCHCLPNLWHEMNVHLSAASCLTWLSQLLNKSDITELFSDAKQHIRKNTPLFLPYLTGERSPHLDPHAKGVFFGLNPDTKTSDLAQAVLEGVAFAFADGQQAMLNAGIEPKEISVVGGGARSRYWGKILASALKRPLLYRKQAEVGGALGAARLAFFAIHGGDPVKVFSPPPLEEVIEPDETLMSKYEQQIKLFQSIYQNLKPLFKI